MDLRAAGSGNIGATNVYRVLGPRWGVAVFALDAAKGAAAAFLTGDPLGRLLAGVAAILGHVFSPWMRFRGGRGVATSLGVFLAILPFASLLAFGLWIVLTAVSKRVSVGSVGACAAYPFLVAAFAAPGPYRVTYVVFASLVAALVVVRHLPNLKRLARGDEPRTFGGKEAKP